MNLSIKNKTQRTFILGDQWLYFKIYTGTKVADSIITECLAPLSAGLLQEGMIIKWFFIRYRDKIGRHLRFRLQVAHPDHLGPLILKIHEALNPLVEKGWVWKIQTDTYQRELERYGEEAAPIAEELFFHDSCLVAKYLSLLENDESEMFRWLISLSTIDAMLEAFGFTKKQKVFLLENMKRTHGKEYGMDTTLSTQLKNKYEHHLPLIEKTMDRNFDSQEMQTIAIMTNCLDQFSKEIQPIVKKIKHLEKEERLDNSLNNLLWSYIHMFMNRLFKSQQRIHEMVVYDFLYRKYTEPIEKYSQKNTSNNKNLTIAVAEKL